MSVVGSDCDCPRGCLQVADYLLILFMPQHGRCPTERLTYYVKERPVCLVGLIFEYLYFTGFECIIPHFVSRSIYLFFFTNQDQNKHEFTCFFEKITILVTFTKKIY